MIMVLSSLVDGTTTLFPGVEKKGSVAVLQNLLYNFKFTPDSSHMSHDRTRFKNIQSTVQNPDTSI